MAPQHCPGQDMGNWKGDSSSEVRCPYCGHEMEFFRDEPTRPCRSCGKAVRNPHLDLGCAKWSKYAKQCLGVIGDGGLEAASLCQRIIERMKNYFGDDAKRITHAMGVLKEADAILCDEPEASGLVVRAAAILHDIGIHEAERKHGSTAGHFQEIEGPPIARDILQDLDVPEDDVTHICRIIANHHNPRGIDTLEFRIVWDSDWLVNIPNEFDALDKNNHNRISQLIEKKFKTKRGKEIAKNIFIKE